MMQENMKSVFAVALETAPPHRANAVWDGTRLVILRCEPITGTPDQWRPKLIDEIDLMSRGGAVTLVEDRTGNFATTPHVTPFCFDDIEDEGRTMFQLCMDRLI